MRRLADRLVNALSITGGLVLVAWIVLLVAEAGGPGPVAAAGWPETPAGTQRVVELDAGPHLLAWHIRPSRVDCEARSPEPPDGFQPRVVDLRTERALPIGSALDSHYCADLSDDIQGQAIAEVEVPRDGRYLLDARAARGASPDERLAIGPHEQEISDRLGVDDPFDLWPLVAGAALVVVLGQGLLYAAEWLPSRGGGSPPRPRP